jgi:hypothetical protein
MPACGSTRSDNPVETAVLVVAGAVVVAPPAAVVVVVLACVPLAAGRSFPAFDWLQPARQKATQEKSPSHRDPPTLCAGTFTSWNGCS